MADDGFETYYAEKLWEMIPAVYRRQDALGENPGVLRALVEVLAGQAAILRRSHDRLWEDQFIELCDDWAVPYLGDLLATRPVSALNPRGRRVDVAKTIYYRRRKGTLAVQEQLIADITGWEGTVVEQFARLGRARHRLEPPPGPHAGRFTGTPPGGWAELRRPRGAELAHGPFDEYHHTPDFRRHRGVEGRFNIPKVAFHLYRLSAWEVEGVTPFPVDADQGRYTFDPSGRDIPLFMPPARSLAPGSDGESWRPVREWELPAPMGCRVLGHAEYRIDGALIRELEAENVLTPSQGVELGRLRDLSFADEPALRRALGALPDGGDFLRPAVLLPLTAGALIADCGKAHLLFKAVAVEADQTPLPEVPPGGPGGRQERRGRTRAADLGNWSASGTRDLAIDPERGRLLLSDAPRQGLKVRYHYGFAASIGAGPYSRPAVKPGPDTYSDSATHSVRDLTLNSSTGPRRRELRAGDRERPYLRLAGPGDPPRDWLLQGTRSDPRDPEPVMVLDGLWVGSRQAGSLKLQGRFERVELHQVTLDPGGDDGRGTQLPVLELDCQAAVDLLKIESSITGPIQVADTVEKLVIRDAIVHSITASATEVYLERVTVLGELQARRLWATETLLTDTARVADTQSGCFRFGARIPASRLPNPYQSHELAETRHLFVSRRFGDPGYGRLSPTAPGFLQRGAENGSEIGAFSVLLNPIKLDSLQAKVDEFLPFGLLPLYIAET